MNATAKYKFTVIVPVFNEEDNMDQLKTRLSDFLQTSIVPACILFVNDGSKDGSLPRIQQMCNEVKGFYYISLTHNCGLSAAIKAGIDYCESEFIGYIDADLQTSPEDFNLLLKEADEYDLVTGIRVGRKDTWWKRRQSKIANSFRRMMTGDTAQDTGCPLKVMHADKAKKIPFFKGMHRFLPALMLLQNGKVQQLPVRHFPRMAGVSKFSMRNRFWGPLNDCFAYRWMKKRYINYEVGDNKI